MDIKQYYIKNIILLVIILALFLFIRRLVIYFQWFDPEKTIYLLYALAIIFAIYSKFQPASYELSKNGIFMIRVGIPYMLYYKTIKSLEIRYKVRRGIESEFLILKFKFLSKQNIYIDLNKLHNRSEFLKTLKEKTGLEVIDNIKTTKIGNI